MSLTVKFLFCKNLMRGGVERYTVKNAKIQETIAGIINSANYLTLRNSDFMLSAMIGPILSISANLFKGIFVKSSSVLIPCL